MKQKDVTPEDLQKLAADAGINVPLEKIKEKLAKLDAMADENKEDAQEETKQEETNAEMKEGEPQ